MIETPLRDRFDAMIADAEKRCKVPLSELKRLALLEAFMAGAAAHDSIVVEAMERSRDPREVARVLDAMAVEIENRESRG